MKRLASVMLTLTFSVPFVVYTAAAWGSLPPCNGEAKKTSECIKEVERIKCSDNSMIDCVGQSGQLVEDVDRCGTGNSTTRCIESTPPQVCTRNYLCGPGAHGGCREDTTQPELDEETGEEIISTIDYFKNESCNAGV